MVNGEKLGVTGTAAAIDITCGHKFGDLFERDGRIYCRRCIEDARREQPQEPSRCAMCGGTKDQPALIPQVVSATCNQKFHSAASEGGEKPRGACPKCGMCDCCVEETNHQLCECGNCGTKYPNYR